MAMQSSSSDPVLLQQDPLYQEALVHLQQGRWQEARQHFDTLAERYPGVNELRSLQEYAQLKASLEQRQPRGRIGGGIRLQNLLTRRRALALLLLLVAGVWFVFFRNYIKPSTDVRASTMRLDDHLSVAASALGRGDYATAQQEYEAVLAEEPENIEAQQGLNNARQQVELESTYARAEALLNEGNWETALPLLQTIQAQSPGYRNTADMLQRAMRGGAMRARYAEASQAFAEGRWQTAIEGYEAVRSLDLRFEQATVTANLFTAYVRQGDLLLETGADAGAAEIALSMLQQALSLKPRAQDASALRDQAQIFLTGHAAFQQGDWRSAVALLRPLYERRPTLLQGALAAMLYDAYLESGGAYQRQRSYTDAYADYLAASQMQGLDVSRARELVEQVGLLLTPTPTPSPSPTPTPAPPTPTPAPPPVVVEPTKLSSPRLKGMIVFRSIRQQGSGLFAMRPDGTGIIPVVDEQATFRVTGPNVENLTVDYENQGFKGLRALDSWTPDRRLRVFVEGTATSKTITSIYLWRYDIPQHWYNVRTQVLDNTTTNYDPVITPDGEVIIFVSQKDGDDEIWRIDADGKNLRQLTKNNWEWDKHPSLSPDGKWIAFWSNRGPNGNGQILVMDLDGKNVRNLSKGADYDWEPIWVK